MAFGRLERKPAAHPMSDINMTPLIDVMLVLLVIFMITAPLMSSSLQLELPRTAAARPNDTAEALALAITADGLVRADKSVPYGQVAVLIGLVQDAGLVRIGFVTEPAAPAR